MKAPAHGGGWRAIAYTLRTARRSGGLLRMWKALRSRNACKTCALGMGGAKGGMVNEAGHFPEFCKKSVQAMAADMQGAIKPSVIDETTFADFEQLSPRQLESLGRITEPLLCTTMDDRFRRVPWNIALAHARRAIKQVDPARSFYYFSGRSSNEAGFLLHLAARLRGTNNVNNCSYYCHQASGVGLASVTGSGTATVVLDDLDQADLVVLIGANPASNHPRFMRSLVEVRRRGGRVVVVNPLRETGLVKFKVPSDVRSMLKASKIADLYIQPTIGGDAMLMAGVMKLLIEGGKLDDAFLRQHTDGWPALQAELEALPWDDVCRESGVDRSTIETLTSMYIASKRTIFAWAMGITHHTHGVRSVQLIGALAAARGMLGRPGCGLLPLRGHSNVQGIGSVGVVPALKQKYFEALTATWGDVFPTEPGLDTLACIEASHAGDMDLAVCLGGNLLGSNPDADYATRAMQNISTLVHLSTTLNTGHVRARGRETIILPVLARDEEPQTTTQESMFNFVRRSSGGTPRLDGPRAETDVIADLFDGVLPSECPVDLDAMRDHDAIREAIAAVVPGYGPVRDGEEFHIPGRTFHEPSFATETGRAHIHAGPVPRPEPVEGHQVRLATLRSEGQFNTVVYEDYDLYRGQERRDVILMNADDMTRMAIEEDTRVTVSSATGTIVVRARAFDIAPSCAAMYYPEANVLVPRTVDPASRTPAFKGLVVTVTPSV